MSVSNQRGNLSHLYSNKHHFCHELCAGDIYKCHNLQESTFASACQNKLINYCKTDILDSGVSTEQVDECVENQTESQRTKICSWAKFVESSGLINAKNYIMDVEIFVWANISNFKYSFLVSHLQGKYF